MWLATALSAAMLALPASPALAGTLDQFSTSGSGNSGGIGIDAGNTDSQGQIFTAGLSGRFDRADLYVRRDCTHAFDPGDALNVQIRTVSGIPAVPTSIVLASANFGAGGVPESSPGWVSVLFPTPATVSAGIRYALVAGTVAPSGCVGSTPLFHWGGTDLDFYGGGYWVTSLDAGEHWGDNAGDLAFRTYVLPTDPGASTGTGTATGTTTATGQRAAALKKCKKKKGAARRKCKRTANRLPV